MILMGMEPVIISITFGLITLAMTMLGINIIKKILKK